MPPSLRPDSYSLARSSGMQARFGEHPLFPGGRLRNYCTYTKVDLEARCLLERAPGSGPQRLRLAHG